MLVIGTCAMGSLSNVCIVVAKLSNYNILNVKDT